MRRYVETYARLMDLFGVVWTRACIALNLGGKRVNCVTDDTATPVINSVLLSGTRVIVPLEGCLMPQPKKLRKTTPPSDVFRLDWLQALG